MTAELPPGPLDHVKLTLVDKTEHVNELMTWLSQRREVLGVDTETGGLQPHSDKLRMVQFGDLGHGWAIPWAQWGGVALEVLDRYRGPLVFHNAKFDVRFIERNSRWRAPWERLHDTMPMSHIDNPLTPNGLKPLAATLVDPKAAAAQKLLDIAMHDNKWTWETIPVEFSYYWMYGAMDPVLTCHIYEKLKSSAFGEQRSVYDLEMGTIRVVTGMEQRGALVDLEYCALKTRELQEYAARVRNWTKEQHGLSNPGSPIQLKQLFYEKLGIPVTRLTDSGQPSTDKYTLTSFTDESFPEHVRVLAQAILDMRSAEKAVGPYFSNFLELADSDSRIHASIHTLGTRTARMSVTQPALQTLPKKDPLIRGAFVPSQGNALITCDADQIEARLAAHFSGSAGLISAFASADAGGGDFFVNLANQIYQTDNVQKKGDKRRDLTKNTLYGKIYGAGVDKMAITAGVPFEQMSAVNGSFDALYPEVKQFQALVGRIGQERLANERKAYVKTPYGRVMPTEEFKIYTLVNYLIQSHAAEILKRNLIALDAVGLGDNLLLPVHDEIIAEAPREDADEVARLIVDTMTDRQTYRVPITWSADVLTDSWGAKYAK